MNGGDDRTAVGTAPPADGGEAAEATIERQIETLRGEIGAMVNELDRRRHEAFDVRLQLRRHRKALLAIGAGAAVVAIVGYRFWAAAQRRREEPLHRMQNLVRAMVLVSQNPDRLVRAMEGRPEPGTAAMTALGKIAGAAGQRAIAGMAAR